MKAPSAEPIGASRRRLPAQEMIPPDLLKRLLPQPIAAALPPRSSWYLTSTPRKPRPGSVRSQGTGTR